MHEPIFPRVMNKVLSNGMSSSRLYCDANASEVPRPAAIAAMTNAIADFGNPSSVHQEGRRARRLLEDARNDIATCLGADPEGIVFTSGGTEANWLGINGVRAGRRVLIGASEHDAVRACVQDGIVVPVLPCGSLDLVALEAMLLQGGPALVCAMAANNETGVLHRLDEIAALCRRYNALLHVDAVQAAGRVPLNFKALGCSSAAISGHKFGGCKGAGAVLFGGEWAASGAVKALIAGGGQERGRRGGTQGMPGIVAMNVALGEAYAQDWAPVRVMRDAIERAAVSVGARVAGRDALRLENTACLILPGVPAQTQLMTLDLAGIAVSAGSACSSGKVARSHVLAAMGCGDDAGCAIRLSLSWAAPDETAERFSDAYAKMAVRLTGRNS